MKCNRLKKIFRKKDLSDRSKTNVSCVRVASIVASIPEEDEPVVWRKSESASQIRIREQAARLFPS